MITLLITIHVICCLGLITIVLLQAGKGAGLAATFGTAAVESALGAQASDFLKKITTVMAVLFMLTSLGLAFTTARKSSSVVKTPKPLVTTQTTTEKEKTLPGLEGKSKEELQQVLKEITKDLPLGEKAKTDSSVASSPTDSTETATSSTTSSQEVPVETTASTSESNVSPKAVEEKAESQPGLLQESAVASGNLKESSAQDTAN